MKSLEWCANTQRHTKRQCQLSTDRRRVEPAITGDKRLRDFSAVYVSTSGDDGECSAQVGFWSQTSAPISTSSRESIFILPICQRGVICTSCNCCPQILSEIVADSGGHYKNNYDMVRMYDEISNFSCSRVNARQQHDWDVVSYPIERERCVTSSAVGVLTNEQPTVEQVVLLRNVLKICNKQKWKTLIGGCN